MLLAYHDQPYSMPLTALLCEAFISQCIKRIQAGDSQTDCQEAVLAIIQHMQHPSMPRPTANSFILVTECLLTDVTSDMPAYQLPVQLQQQVWEKMHQELGSGPDTVQAYVPALTPLRQHRCWRQCCSWLRMALEGWMLSAAWP